MMDIYKIIQEKIVELHKQIEELGEEGVQILVDAGYTLNYETKKTETGISLVARLEKPDE